MRTAANCFLLLLLVIGSIADAQEPCNSGPPTRALIDWPQFGSGPCRTSFNPYEFVLSPSTVGNLVADWQYPLAQVVFASPAVVNGVVYFPGGDASGTVYAFNARTGTVLWQSTVVNDEQIISTPAVADGILYVGVLNNYTLYALDISTGTVLWTYATGGYVGSSPAVANGIVYFESWNDDHNVYALDARTGAVRWTYTMTAAGILGTSPAVANGVVYVGSDYVYALDANTGALLWKYGPGIEDFAGSPAVANGVVYVGDGNGVDALNASTGAVVWESGVAGSTSSPGVANGAVYIASDKMFALNAGTGAMIWEYTTTDGHGFWTSPTVANGVVYAGSFVTLYALNAVTGELLWQFTDGTFVESSPAVVNGWVYDASYGGSLYAFHLPNQ